MNMENPNLLHSPQDFDNFHAPQFQTFPLHFATLNATCPLEEATVQVQRPASHQICSQEIIPQKCWSKKPSNIDIDIDRYVGISW